MRYQEPTFTLPVASKRVTQEQYEIAVGLRCPKCKALMRNKHVCGRCPVASKQTGGEFFCTREAGHDGPCAAVPAC